MHESCSEATKSCCIIYYLSVRSWLEQLLKATAYLNTLSCCPARVQAAIESNIDIIILMKPNTVYYCKLLHQWLSVLLLGGTRMWLAMHSVLFMVWRSAIKHRVVFIMCCVGVCILNGICNSELWQGSASNVATCIHQSITKFSPASLIALPLT